jgi:hypothetical protein
MTAPIMQAISSGFSSQQVLSYLIRKFPQHAKKISHALAMGYTPTQVLSYLSGGKKAVNTDEVAQTEHEATIKADKRRRNTNEALVAGTAAAAAGGLGFGLSRLGGAAGSNAIRGQLLPALPGGGRIAGSPTLQIGHTPVNVPPNPTPTNPNPNNMGGGQGGNLAPSGGQPPAMPPSGGMPPPSPMPPASNLSSPSQSPIQNVANSITQGVGNQQVPENNLEPLTEQDKAYRNILDRQKESSRLFELAKEKRPGKEGTTPFMRMARDLVKKGQIKDAEEFDEFRKYWARTEGQRRGSPLIEFETFRSQKPKFQEPQPEPAKLSPTLQGAESPINSDIVPDTTDKTTGFGQNTPNLREKIAQMPKLAKDSTVISPIGLGRIKELRNGKAMLDVDGKKHVVNEDELIESPLPEKDLAELYEDMVSGIQKKTGQEMSRNVNWAGYDPKSNELAYRPHDGRLYVYDNISPEDAEELTSLLNTRKTTGENFIGAWQSGSQSPIGAAMSRLILRLQKERGGKGNEYSGKFETLYDAIEPAVKAAKAKHAEERKRKKKA